MDAPTPDPAELSGPDMPAASSNGWGMPGWFSVIGGVLSIVTFSETIRQKAWLALPLTLLYMGAVLPSSRLMRWRNQRVAHPEQWETVVLISATALVLCLVSEVLVGLATAGGIPTAWLLTSIPVLIVELLIYRHTANATMVCGVSANLGRLKMEPGKAFAAICIALVLCSGLGVAVALGAAPTPGTPVQTISSSSSSPSSTIRTSSTSASTSTSTSTSTPVDLGGRNRIASSSQSADEYCGTNVQKAFDAQERDTDRAAYLAAIRPGIQLGGCPPPESEQLPNLFVWFLKMQDGSGGGAVLKGPDCPAVLVIPEAVDAMRRYLDSGELACADEWAFSGNRRYQVLQLVGGGCRFELARTPSSAYQNLPAAVADVTFQISSTNGMQPYVESLSADGGEYLVAFDDTVRGLVKQAEVTIEYDASAGVATANNKGMNHTGIDGACPTVPSSLNPDP
jgi:hypothetical protein